MVFSVLESRNYATLEEVRMGDDSDLFGVDDPKLWDRSRDVDSLWELVGVLYRFLIVKRQRFVTQLLGSLTLTNLTELRQIRKVLNTYRGPICTRIKKVKVNGRTVIGE